MPTVDTHLRSALLIVVAFMFAGTPVELLLADHTAETAQFIPFLLCGAAFIAILAVLVRPRRTTLRILRGVMVLNILGGLLGMVLHLIGNYNFEREIRPNAQAADLIADTLKGVNPLLAPGMLIFFAVVALIAVYNYPDSENSADAGSQGG